MSFDEFKVISLPMNNYNEYIEQFSSSLPENMEIKGNDITGNITVDEDKILFINILYSRGWSAYVDGKKTEIINADTAYMGLNITKGTHKFELRYTTPYIRLGLICTILAALGVTVFYIYQRKRGETNEQ